MTPTNTPTSKCCEKCFCRQGTRAGGGTYCFYDFNGCCHTPTTDSKNSSEKKCCGKCSGEFKDECYCPYETCCNTTDTGWDGVRAAIESKPHEQYGKVDCWALDKAIKELAKEEYERGRKDAVEFIRAKSEEAVKGLWYVQESTLEAALETPS